MENCRFADSNDHGCPFDNNNKAWWVCLDRNEVELFSWTIYDLLELFPGVWTKWTASWMLTWTRPQHWLSLDISTASLGIDCFFCWEQGCIFRLMCSYPVLTEDHVLTSAYVKIFRIVTRNAVNKSLWRKKDYSWLPLNKHAMNIWLRESERT